MCVSGSNLLLSQSNEAMGKETDPEQEMFMPFKGDNHPFSMFHYVTYIYINVNELRLSQRHQD